MKELLLNKKTAGFVIAGTIAVSSLGGTAYAAYGNHWDAYITKGIDKLYMALFPEIKQKTEDKQNEIIGKISNDISQNMKSINEGLIKRKGELIERNQKELDNYYNETVNKAEATANQVVKDGKDALDKKADEDLDQAKKNIDSRIQSELEKIAQ